MARSYGAQSTTGEAREGADLVGKLGVWSNIDSFSATQAQAFAQRVERWGYGTFWAPEGLGREVFSAAAWLLAGTNRLTVASGIANIYARDPVSAAAAQKGLNEQSGGRFLLGLGVSHIPLVQDVRRHVYGKPVETMRAYLTALQAAPYRAVAPDSTPRTVIAALGPKMLALAGELADGAHPYNVPPEHTAQARDILGRNKLLCVEQALILESDAREARARARQFLSFYLRLPNYANNWKRLGFTDTDLAGDGSDRLIDATIAWGDERAIRARLDAHWQAGADHVCVQALGTGGMPDEQLLELLAPGRA
ncbi:MAG TPA: TIGR03620 family F420-dependent LLM class oxidoreductase [Steroidobacteraceae bacterium]|jgi:probable F420-dependent oxidoreductase|nr:TIGR03620 family F420-dependent LLM class oxidoreductase [Steroidobacteraceae bacterium]